MLLDANQHNQKPLSLKLINHRLAIAVGRGKTGTQAITINIIYTWMLSCGVVCVPGELNGVTAVADEPGDILNQPNRLKQAEILGFNMLKAAKVL